MEKIMRRIFSTVMLLTFMLLGAAIVMGQDEKQSFTATGVYLRKDNKLEKPTGEDFKYNAQRDSVGFEVAYDYAVTKYLAIGMQGGATFHNQSAPGVINCGSGCVATKQGNSKVALAWADYYMQLQRRKGTFQPFIKGTIGPARADFGGITAGPGGFVGRSANMFTYGAELGSDVKVGKATYLRLGIAAKQLIGGDSRQFDLGLKGGLSFRF